MSGALTVFRAFTTRVWGRARWSCSASESVLHTDKVGGMPREKSRGFEASIRILPARRSTPAARTPSTDTRPARAFTTTSPWAAASARVRTATVGWAAAQAGNGGLPKPSGWSRARVAAGSRVPIATSWPRVASLAARV